MRYSEMALPKTLAPATISRMVTVVTIDLVTACFSPAQVSVRSIGPVIKSAAAKPIAAASVGVNTPQ